MGFVGDGVLGRVGLVRNGILGRVGIVLGGVVEGGAVLVC